MTLKTYQNIKIALVIMLAAIFSWSIASRNYILPLVSLVTGFLVILHIRRQVTEVIADERDYLAGGQAAFVSIQIYSWVAAVSVFVLYAFRDRNAVYEPVAFVLAFSVCLLLAVYGFLYHFFNKSVLKDKAQLLYAVVMLAVIIALVVSGSHLFLK